MSLSIGPFLFVFVYPVLPWIGVMLLGCGVSGVFERPANSANATCGTAGVALTVASSCCVPSMCMAIRIPGSGRPAAVVATVMDFLNTTKYPPSLDFLLMTLGPSAVVCALADRITRTHSRTGW